MRTNRERLTLKQIEDLKPRDKDFDTWDSDVPGLKVKTTPAGKKVYVVQVRSKTGKQLKITLGPHPILKLQKARELAMAALAEIAAGKDPMAERKAAKKMGTVSDLASRYITEHARVKKKESSADEDQRLLDTVILPALGRKKLTEIRRADIQKLHWDRRETPYQANRVLALLSKMFKLAERWDLRPEHSNPCHHVERYKEQSREQFLSDEGYRRLIKVLYEAETERTVSPSAILAIRLLMLTGRRKGEILKLRWADLDLVTGTMTLPDTKTGRKRFALSPEVADLLVRSKSSAYQSEWVIPGRRRGKPMDNIQKPWERIRKRAGLEDVRLHDLRHSYAAMAAMSGQSLLQIGAQLGHSQPQTTKRYTHFTDRSLAASTAAVSAKISAFSKPKEADYAGV